MSATTREPVKATPKPVWVLAVISLGGGCGALLRWAVSVETTGFGWTTWAVNMAGCLIIGTVMTLVNGPLLRPFLGVGVLGGFTTFSTYIAEALGTEKPHIGLIYLFATPVMAVMCTALAVIVTRRLVRP